MLGQRARVGFGIAGLLLLAAAGCTTHDSLRADFDTLDLPPDLIQISEEEGQFGFGGSPRLARYYLSGRPLNDVCSEVIAAVEDWGVREATWRIDQSERNPCTGSARRGSYWVALAVNDFDRFVNYVDEEAAPVAARETIVSIELQQP